MRPPKRMWKSSLLVPVHVTLFGSRVIADIMKLLGIIQIMLDQVVIMP